MELINVDTVNLYYTKLKGTFNQGRFEKMLNTGEYDQHIPSFGVRLDELYYYAKNDEDALEFMDKMIDDGCLQGKYNNPQVLEYFGQISCVNQKTITISSDSEKELYKELLTNLLILEKLILNSTQLNKKAILSSLAFERDSLKLLQIGEERKSQQIKKMSENYR